MRWIVARGPGSTPSPLNFRKIFSPLSLGVDLMKGSRQNIWNQLLSGKIFHPEELTGGGSLL